MLNTRTLILSTVLVILLVFSVQFVTARTEIVSNPSSDPAVAPENEEQPADYNNTYNVLAYRSQFGECFDVPIRDLAGCRSVAQTPVQYNRQSLDECFDVSINELAGCRRASQQSAP